METEDRLMPKVFRLYLAISRYPILSRVIRERMREELFSRGIITREAFEREVQQKAIRSQKREGLTNPLYEENINDWQERLKTVRAQLTDFYFAYNLPYSLFSDIVRGEVSKRSSGQESEIEVSLSFNPELAPWDVLFSEGERYERLPPDEREMVKHHLREIIVVLTKAMISSDLNFVGLASRAFNIEDLKKVRTRRIGRGKIGGKAAGMLLAWKLLKQSASDVGLDPDRITIPESYFIGSDVFYMTHENNGFHRYMNQKYKKPEEIIADYPEIYANYMRAHLPDDILLELRSLLETIGPKPLIVRSSSLLEDSFGTAFAGKYDSFFLPNQSTVDKNLAAMERAILRVYASTLKPDALIYRQRMNLIDMDERMAVLIQEVHGQHYGQYFLPVVAGVGFSRNPFRWTQKIRREDGFLRLVAGLGTRAVDRVDSDYPRMIALSHPTLRPETRVEQLRQYSQHYIDVLDMEANAFKTLPIKSVADANFPGLKLLAAEDHGQHLQQFVSRPTRVDPDKLVFTFDRLAAEPAFSDMMRNLLASLQEAYKRPVDIEFAVDIVKTWPKPEFQVCLLQCRPLSEHAPELRRSIPKDIPDEDKIFSANHLVPEGAVERIRYVIYVSPEAYNHCEDATTRLEVGRVVGRLNQCLQDEVFIAMGPGRWGTSNLQLGVKVTFAEIHYCRALVEIALPDGKGGTPEMAYGTHFFQDLVEANTYPLALFPAEPEAIFNWGFFEQSPNALPDLLPEDAHMADYVRVIDVPAASHGRRLELIMDSEKDEALAYLKWYE